MKNHTFDISLNGKNKQNWFLTLVTCKNLIHSLKELQEKWNEATGDDGVALINLINKIKNASEKIYLSIEETVIAYSSLIILNRHLGMFTKNVRKDGVHDCFPFENDFPEPDKWQIFALNAFEELYFNEDYPYVVNAVVNANKILGKSNRQVISLPF